MKLSTSNLLQKLEINDLSAVAGLKAKYITHIESLSYAEGVINFYIDQFEYKSSKQAFEAYQDNRLAYLIVLEFKD